MRIRMLPKVDMRLARPRYRDTSSIFYGWEVSMRAETSVAGLLSINRATAEHMKREMLDRWCAHDREARQ